MRNAAGNVWQKQQTLDMKGTNVTWLNGPVAGCSEPQQKKKASQKTILRNNFLFKLNRILIENKQGTTFD